MTEPLARRRPLPRGPETWARLLVARRAPRTGRPGGSELRFVSLITHRGSLRPPDELSLARRGNRPRRRLPRVVSPRPSPPSGLLPPERPVAAPRLFVRSGRPPRPSTGSLPRLQVGTLGSRETCCRGSPRRRSALPLPARLPRLLWPEEGLGARPAPPGGRRPVCASLAPTWRALTRPHAVRACVHTRQNNPGAVGAESPGPRRGSAADRPRGLGQAT